MEKPEALNGKSSAFASLAVKEREASGADAKIILSVLKHFVPVFRAIIHRPGMDADQPDKSDATMRIMSDAKGIADEIAMRIAGENQFLAESGWFKGQVMEVVSNLIAERWIVDGDTDLALLDGPIDYAIEFAEKNAGIFKAANVKPESEKDEISTMLMLTVIKSSAPLRAEIEKDSFGQNKKKLFEEFMSECVDLAKNLLEEVAPADRVTGQSRLYVLQSLMNRSAEILVEEFRRETTSRFGQSPAIDALRALYNATAAGEVKMSGSKIAIAEVEDAFDSAFGILSKSGTDTAAIARIRANWISGVQQLVAASTTMVRRISEKNAHVADSSLKPSN